MASCALCGSTTAPGENSTFSSGDGWMSKERFHLTRRILTDGITGEETTYSFCSPCAVSTICQKPYYMMALNGVVRAYFISTDGVWMAEKTNRTATDKRGATQEEIALLVPLKAKQDAQHQANLARHKKKKPRKEEDKTSSDDEEYGDDDVKILSPPRSKRSPKAKPSPKELEETILKLKQQHLQEAKKLEAAEEAQRKALADLGEIQKQHHTLQQQFDEIKQKELQWQIAQQDLKAKELKAAQDSASQIVELTKKLGEVSGQLAQLVPGNKKRRALDQESNLPPKKKPKIVIAPRARPSRRVAKSKTFVYPK